MAFEIPSLAIIEVRLSTQMSGQHMLNVWHYQTNFSIPQDGPTVYDAVHDFLCVAGIDNMLSKYQAMTNTALDFTDLAVQCIYPIRNVARTYDIAEPGLVEGAPLPQNVQMSLLKQTDLAGRKYRGRMELVGFTVGDYAEGVWGEAILDAANLFKLELLDPITFVNGTLQTLTPVLFHRATPSSPTPITSMSLKNTVRVARRRTVGVGK